MYIPRFLPMTQELTDLEGRWPFALLRDQTMVDAAIGHGGWQQCAADALNAAAAHDTYAS